MKYPPPVTGDDNEKRSARYYTNINSCMISATSVRGGEQEHWTAPRCFPLRKKKHRSRRCTVSGRPYCPPATRGLKGVGPLKTQNYRNEGHCLELCLIFSCGLLPLQSDWSLSCDPGLDYASKCDNNNNKPNSMARRRPAVGVQ